jgi:hypothetical protein
MFTPIWRQAAWSDDGMLTIEFQYSGIRRVISEWQAELIFIRRKRRPY